MVPYTERDVQTGGYAGGTPVTTIGEQPLISTIYDRLLIEDDTEESVSGSDFHLAAILALYDVLLRYAQRTARRWYVTAEVMVLVDVPDRYSNPWRPMPDVYVVLDTAATPRTSLDTREGNRSPRSSARWPARARGART